MNKKYPIFLWFILALGSCHKTNTPGTPAAVDVYIIGGGSLNTNTLPSIARYWKNNQQFDLPGSTVSDLGILEDATGIAVSGNDVYICGNGWGSRGSQGDFNITVKYWKNGVPVNITDGSTVALATAIGITGSDVYVTGQESTIDRQQTFAKYWKNGVGVILPGIYPTGIAFLGKDVYISGVMRNTVTGQGTAIYLKNEIPVRLTDGSSDARANAILIEGSDIYVAGYDGNRAVYWKNQVPVYLTDGSTPVALLSIAVEGSDVLVAGNNGTYWKNGIPVSLSETPELSGVALAGGNVYVVGNIYSGAMHPNPGYWINTERQSIFDSTSNSTTSQILVVKH